MIQLDVGNVLLKPSQRRQLMARLRRCQKLGSRLGNFLLRITFWRTGRQFELRAAVRDRDGTSDAASAGPTGPRLCATSSGPSPSASTTSACCNVQRKTHPEPFDTVPC